MRIRTVYFKVKRAEEAAEWWAQFLQAEQTKALPQWHEFAVGETNLGLLALDNAGTGTPSCVPVFQFPNDRIDDVIRRAKELGAAVVLEGEEHPDYPNTAAVLRDPFGNEFEVTNYGG